MYLLAQKVLQISLSYNGILLFIHNVIIFVLIHILLRIYESDEETESSKLLLYTQTLQYYKCILIILVIG